MAEEEKEGAAEGEEGAAEGKSAGGKRKLFIMIGGGVALVLILAAAGYFMLAGKKQTDTTETIGQHAVDHEDEVPEGSGEEDEFDEGEEPLGAIFPLETFTVNLAGANRFIRCQMQIEFTERSVPKRFYLRQVPVRDAIIKLLTSRTAEELANNDGKDALKEEIKDMINQYLRREAVKRIYFTQFVVQ